MMSSFEGQAHFDYAQGFLLTLNKDFFWRTWEVRYGSVGQTMFSFVQGKGPTSCTITLAQ